MTNVAVVGAQWGDEGKGKIVDFLSHRADVVVRHLEGEVNEHNFHLVWRASSDSPILRSVVEAAAELRESFEARFGLPPC